ncbi:hypothetical protein RIF29_17698 [Crotalaria pallida]|uniref:Uncharacterized protein n=1 Tax=Crotalaria pallida TaxID=3830 RepID=A0AAN9FNF0_CROPI
MYTIRNTVWSSRIVFALRITTSVTVIFWGKLDQPPLKFILLLRLTPVNIKRLTALMVNGDLLEGASKDWKR